MRCVYALALFVVCGFCRFPDCVIALGCNCVYFAGDATCLFVYCFYGCYFLLVFIFIWDLIVDSFYILHVCVCTFNGFVDWLVWYICV